MTKREKEMMYEIVQLKLALLHAHVGDGNCQTRMYPLSEHDFKCGDYGDCSTCRAEYYKLAEEEITNRVQRKYEKVENE